ncbi:MAG: MarR family winged helix-turn-helix transcriptional regulator [Lachnospiraceae bacterium]
MECKNTILNQWDSPHSSQIKAFIDVTRLHRTVLERKLNQTGVYRSQHQILRYIVKNPNASQKDIARLHHASTATIAVSLKKLEKGGYIKRMVDRKDNRYNQIMITEKGQAVLEVSMQYFQLVEERMFEGFSEPEMEQLEYMLGKIKGNLNLLLEMEREGQKPDETI